MINKQISILIVAFTLLQSSECCQWNMEAERGFTNGIKIPRGAASGKLTVRLNESQYIIWAFVTDYECKLQVFNIVYTNDGFSDMITLYVDSAEMGSFDTREKSDNGHLWNEPISSGQIGNETWLSAGDHTFKLVAADVDPHLVEIDRATLDLLCLYASDGICPKSQDPDTIIDTEPWERGHIIALAFGLIGTVVGAVTLVIGILSLITGLYIRGRNENRHGNAGDQDSNDLHIQQVPRANQQQRQYHNVNPPQLRVALLTA